MYQTTGRPPCETRTNARTVNPMLTLYTCLGILVVVRVNIFEHPFQRVVLIYRWIGRRRRHIFEIHFRFRLRPLHDKVPADDRRRKVHYSHDCFSFRSERNPRAVDAFLQAFMRVEKVAEHAHDAKLATFKSSG
ncbi:hypothetical protein AC1031_019872 [Aphanomyces cochlioides]|nr:hypothetical protein AC1031_019872 [Aphanomyces cochlioides]